MTQQNRSSSSSSRPPSKKVVTYEVMFGTPAQPDDPHAIPVRHRGGDVHAVYDRTVTHEFRFLPDAGEDVYGNDKTLRAAAHKALVQKVRVGDDADEYFIPLGTTVQNVEVR